MKLDEYFENRYRPIRLLGKSKETVRLYRLSIKAFGRTLGRTATLADLTDESVSRHMQARLDAGCSPSTANKDRNQLLAIWRQAHRDNLIQSVPQIQSLPEPERTPVAWLPDEIARIYATIGKLDGSVGDVPARYWWEALVRLGLDTGERINALRSARWDWIASRWINFPAEVRKGGRRDRAYKLSQQTIDAMERVRTHARSRECFPWPYNPNYLWSKYKKILEAAGLPSGRRQGFHQLRRTVGSVVFACGSDPQEALDHSSRRVTQKYLDPRFSRDTSVCDILAQYLQNPRRDDRQGEVG